MVSPLMSDGNLHDYLSNTAQVLSVGDRFNIVSYFSVSNRLFPSVVANISLVVKLTEVIDGLSYCKTS